MRKFRPVAILLAIQLIIAVSLALINPINDYIIRKKGTEYTFATQEAYLTGDFSSYVEINCRLKFGFDYNRFGYYPEEYGIIDTDKNSLAYISELSRTKPEGKDYLGTDKKSYAYISHFTSDEIKLDLISFETKNVDFLLDKDLGFLDNHEVTVNVSVYKGDAVVNEFYIDGIKAEEYLKNLKG